MQITSASVRALQTGFNTTFNNAFNDAPSYYEKVAMTVNSNHSSETYAWMNNWDEIRKWVGDRVLTNISASDYTIKNEKYEGTVVVKLDDIEDDSFGIYAPRFAMMGQAAKVHPDTLVFDLLKNGFTQTCFDGQYFFDTDHPVGTTTYSNHQGGSGTAWFLLDTSRPIKPFIFQKRRDYRFISMDSLTDEAAFMRDEIRYGVDARVSAGYALPQLAYSSKQTLDLTNYTAARAAMRSLKNENGKPLGIEPMLLVVPPSLEAAALQLLNAEMINGTSNTMRGTAQLLVTPWLA